MDPFSQFMSQNRAAYGAANPPPAPPPVPAPAPAQSRPQGHWVGYPGIPPEPGAGTYGRVNPGGGVTIGSGAGTMQQPPNQGGIGMNPFAQLLQKLLGMGQFGGGPQQPFAQLGPMQGTYGSVGPGGQVNIGSGTTPFTQSAQQQPGGAGGGLYGGGGNNPMLGLLQALLGRGMNLGPGMSMATGQVPPGGGQPVIRY